MCEPLTIATGVASLFAASIKLTHTLLALRLQFERVPETIQQLCNEFHMTSAGLGELESLLRVRQDVLSNTSQRSQEKQNILQCVDATTISMARSFAMLGSELEKLKSDEASGTRSISWRMRFMWVEKDLNGVMMQIRDQRSSLSFLMQIIQLAKIDDIHRQFQSTSPGLSALRRTATVAKGSRPSLVRPSAVSNESITPDLQNILKQDTKFPDLEDMKNTQPPPASTQSVLDETATKPEQPRASASVPQSPGQSQPSAVPWMTRPSWPAVPYAPSRRVGVEHVHHELHYAVANNDLIRLPFLMDSGQDPLGLPLNPYGTLPNANKTSLSLAAYLGREQVMRVFLERGFGWAINECVGNDLPPVLAAAYAGQERMLKILLEAKANPRLRGPGNNHALFWASARGHAHIVNLLVQHGAGEDVSVANDKGQTPLMVASQNGHHQVMHTLITQGADVHSKNNKLQSPIHLAAHGGHFEAIKLLVSHSAQLNSPTTNGKTPLIFAAISGYFDAVDALADAGAFINLQDVDGKTALYHAASLGNSEAVEVLLDRYASTEVVTKQGDRALHIAAEKGHGRVVGLLLDRGARLEATRTSDGQSALEIAVWHKHRDILGPLILFRTEQSPAEYSKQDALYTAVEWMLTEAMNALLEAGADINGDDGDDQTLLARAIRENKLETASLLIERGASVNLADKYGAMPLHRAARASNTKLAQTLISAGAEMGAVDRNGQTPLQIAEVYGTQEIVELLRKHRVPTPPSELPSAISDEVLSSYQVVTGTPIAEDAIAPLAEKVIEPVELPAFPLHDPLAELP